MVYEEHILQLSEAFAGLPPGREDVLRRALNKQKRSVICEIRGEFFASAQARGHPPPTAWKPTKRHGLNGFSPPNSWRRFYRTEKGFTTRLFTSSNVTDLDWFGLSREHRQGWPIPTPGLEQLAGIPLNEPSRRERLLWERVDLSNYHSDTASQPAVCVGELV